MLYTIPDYYTSFQCSAEKCEDTCCAGWQIVIDRKSLEKYRKEKSGYRRTLRKKIDWRQKCFRQDGEKRCAFLTEENLCEMYQNLGEKSLCRTCRMYPRHVEEFENVREISLSVSCPEVAKILMSRTEKVEFRSYEKASKEDAFDGFDPFLYSQLLDTRELLIKILQNREIPIEERLVLCTGLAYDIQNRVDRGSLFACGDVLERYRGQLFGVEEGAAKKELAEENRVEDFVDKKTMDTKYLAEAQKKAEQYRASAKTRYTFSRKMLENLYRLELLRKEWDMQLQEAEVRLFGKGPEAYAQQMDEFEAWIQTKYEADWAIQCEQLMVYFVFTYFCGAVYDGQIFVNMQMAVASVNVLWNLMAAKWLRNEKTLYLEDVIETVYQYSRELEHSDKNLKHFWNMLEEQRKLF